MTANELRRKYNDFFKTKGHTEISGKSLIPENDPTVLFNTAGMQPLVPYILGEKHPGGVRLCDVQKCIRTGDIEEVGDYSHLTFFEMLGNWSLGDYFKKESISWSFEFLTSKQWLGIPVEKLAVTVFEGEPGIPRDEESADIWAGLGIPRSRIHYLPRKDNWWGPAGTTGPCGPDTEIFFKTDRSCAKGDKCEGPSCSCKSWVEIWNNVFMQYDKQADGSYAKLARPCVDTGMGLDRTSFVLQGKNTVYATELFQPILKALSAHFGHEYGSDDKKDQSMRIIADHVKTACFVLADAKAVRPSNLGAGYVLRRLIRRAIRHGKKLGAQGAFLHVVLPPVIEIYKGVYDELSEKKDFILAELAAEESRFLETLNHGEHEFEKMLPGLLKNPKKVIGGRVAFKLYDTYGFPIELTEELAAENGMTVDRAGFDEAFAEHQEKSKAGADKTFKGGLADGGEATTALHTATHLLHKALRMTLGDHVQQKGSNITPERLRFDFSHPAPMTAEEVAKVQEIVNNQIQRGLPVTMEIMPLEKARASGAMALFGEKYEETVKVYTIGDFSKEVCGGPHVETTAGMGRFVIQKEQSSSAGIRRIRAVLEK
jgi:alanyl-tRNA synthetase